MKVEWKMESLEACAGPPAIYLFTPETPVDAKVLEKAWRSLGKTLGEILALRWPK